MKTTYYQEDDILVVRLSENPIVKEKSLDWNTHVAFDDAGNVVELVIVGEDAAHDH